MSDADETATVRQTPLEKAQAQALALAERNEKLSRQLNRARGIETRLRAENLRKDAYIAHLEDKTREEPLTGLGNRRAFDEMLDGMARQYAYVETGRQAKPFSLLILDLDDLKKWNKLGHPTGDRVLQEIGEAIHSVLRTQDRAFRIGGDEFAVILADSNCDGARKVAERICRRLKQISIHGRSPSMCIGGSCVCTLKSPEEIYHAADLNEIAAKKNKGTAQPTIIITNGDTP